jgi:hypothetical protein
MKFSFLSMLSFLLLNLLFCCTKEEVNLQNTQDDGLPQATQTGAHTLGFYLNDQPWLPSQDCSRNCEALTSYYSEAGFINGDRIPYYNIYAKQAAGTENEEEQRFEMQITRLTPEHTYSLHNQIFAPLEELASYAIFIKTSPSGNKRLYISDSTKTPFLVNITKVDYLNNTTFIPIVSGTFEGVLYNQENSLDSLIISKGRFDLKE